MRALKTMLLGVMLPLALAVTAAPASAAPRSGHDSSGAAAGLTGAAAGLTDVVAVAAKKKKKKKKTVMLTFDDGPGDYTYQVLDVLKKHKVKATFCVLGQNVGWYPKTSNRIVKEGHKLCNHSWDHADMTTLTEEEARTQLVDSQEAIAEVTKVTPKLMRFPYGASNKKLKKLAKDLKLKVLGWDVDPEDWRNPSAKKITAHIVKHTKSGDIVLLHDGGGDRTMTVKSLADTIKKLKKKGFKFVLP